MKIRTKLTLRYLFVTALLVIAVFFVLEELLFPQAGYDMLHILNTRLLAVWAVSFGLLFVIGYFMARSVLKPVSEIVKQVEAITASNLSKRVEVEDHKDEIGELARTFNKTLDRLEESFEAQKMFISNVSHELRTPMAALIAELELSLYKERSSEDYKKVKIFIDDYHKDFISQSLNGIKLFGLDNYENLFFKQEKDEKDIQEFKKIQEAALFNKLDVHSYRTMVVVIGNEDSIKDTKEI